MVASVLQREAKITCFEILRTGMAELTRSKTTVYIIKLPEGGYPAGGPAYPDSRG